MKKEEKLGNSQAFFYRNFKNKFAYLLKIILFSIMMQFKNANMTFYIQIKMRGISWDNTPAYPIDFVNRDHAVEQSKKLAGRINSEVRLTDNSKLIQGTYFR